MHSMSRWVPTRYADRRAAGRALAALLEAERGPDTVVVGLARGGVPVAAEVAAALGAPLDVVVVRKVGHPLQPELALGAVTADGPVCLPPLPELRIATPQAPAIAAAKREAGAIEARLRAGHPRVDLTGATCVLVDDGLATGASMEAAIHWARGQGAARIVVGVPVAATSSARALREHADAVLCPLETDELGSVGAWYRDFGQVPERRVAADLRAARRPGRQ
jgi:putative phosphoribosyl transferase